MRVEEAQVIARFVSELGIAPGSVCLNLGASTKQFRTVDQPHIDEELCQPLERIGLKVVHCDIKSEIGVDEVGDVLDVNFRRTLATYDASLVLCCNLLEHLSDPQAFAIACVGLIRRNAYLVVSVPKSYPFHPDPIDNGTRLSPEGIAELFRGTRLVRSAVVSSGGLWRESVASPSGMRSLARLTARLLLPVYRPGKWRAIAHRFLWLFRPYQVSVAVLIRS